MKKIIYYLFIIFILINSSVSLAIDFNVNRDESLGSTSDGVMDSDWPMFGHDLRHTGRSPYALDGNLPVLKWIFRPDADYVGPMYGSPVIDNNGIIYAGIWSENELFAINPDGSLKWASEKGPLFSFSPALASDGTIYLVSDDIDYRFYAINPDGSRKWSYKTNGDSGHSAASIAEDGTIYFAADNIIYSLHPNGTLNWKFGTNNDVYSSPAIDENGIIYFGSQDSFLYALYPNSTVKWKFKTNRPIVAAPAIGDDGTIYICSWDDHIYAVDQNGSMIWKFKTDEAIQEAPAIDSDGTLYVATYAGSLYAINPDGTLKWEYIHLADYSINSWPGFFTSPVVDSNGVVYIGGCYDGCFYAVNPDGSLRWKLKTSDHIDGSAAISSDGTIYFGNCRGNLYAYHTIQNDKPSIPEIQGPQTGKIREEYTVQVRTIDPEEDDIKYWIDWGDNTNSGWIGPYPSGEWVNVSHTWFEQGDYSIRVKAMDVHPAVVSPSRDTEFAYHSIVLSKSKIFIDHIKDIFEFILSLFDYENLEVIDFPLRINSIQ